VASRFALRIDALHGEAGQKLHFVFPHGRGAFCGCGPKQDPNSPVTDGCWRGFWRRPTLLSSGNTTIYCGWVAGGSWYIRRQAVLRRSFILQGKKQEAERKRIEAQGIADFQKIVAQGISAQLLEGKGIEAEKLAMSNNAKVIVIGNPQNGLPLVLEPR
jgi:hypothetical protein